MKGTLVDEELMTKVYEIVEQLKRIANALEELNRRTAEGFTVENPNDMRP